jgi:putative membrane-bound dehydrogenase-like protein
MNCPLPRIVFLASVVLFSVAARAAEPRSTAIIKDPARPSDEELKAFLTPEPRKTPTEALKTFETAPGFHLELVAAEPMVYDPVVAAFDEDGGLYVGEMRDYPYPGVKQSGHTPRFPGDQFREDEYARPRAGRHPPTKSGDKPLGSVRLLRDTDGDGKFDQATVFADGLLWVCGIVPWKGGVFVTAPPDIWYLKDTDGDGRADVREKVFTGFGTRNQQAMLNNLQFGFDHMIYGSTAGNGGDVRPGNAPDAQPVALAGYDFRFGPEARRIERVTGTRQFGLAFDDWGNRFLCTQNAPCFHVVLPLHYLERNPHFTPRQTIASTTSVPTPLYRISPVEKWRFLQSSRAVAMNEQPVGDVAGVSHHVIDAGAGITIYRGGAYPEEYYGNVFVGDSVSNLVHRRVLVPHGATFKSERADANTEFVRSSDIWFRPVNFINAPDGTLYVLDMSREYSESINIPPDIERHLDLTTCDQGRIYRIAPDGFRPPPAPRLSRATTVELVAALESPHGWWRDTAHRLIYERQDKTAASALVKIATHSDFPAARVQALWSLHGLNALENDILATALADAHPGVRENAIRLAEPRLERSARLREKVLALISDSEPRVRLQVAFAIGECRAWDQAGLLARLVRENLSETWIQSAVLSSAAACGGTLLEAVSRSAELPGNAAAIEFARQLVTMTGAQNRTEDVARTIRLLAETKQLEVALPLVAALAEGLKRAGASVAAADPNHRMKSLLQRAPAVALDAQQSTPVRRASIEALALLPYAEARPTLLRLLADKKTESLRLATIATLDQFHDASVGADLIEAYQASTGPGRARALDAILQRPERLAALWAALETRKIQPADLSARHRDFLRKHREPDVRERALRMLGPANSVRREEVYTALLPALQLRGVSSRGRATFESRCALCHRYAGLGHEFGPDLTAVRTGGKEKILVSIVDPNREVLPQFFVVTADLKDGETVGGIIRNETATTVTLRQPGGNERTIARHEIATLKVSSQSFMPEGIEAGLSAQDIADLIEFLLEPPHP